MHSLAHLDEISHLRQLILHTHLILSRWWHQRANLGKCKPTHIGRIVAVMGLNRLMWRWLNTGIFAFLGSADAEGRVDVDEEELGRRLQAALRWMQWVGAGLVLLAGLLQMVWAVPATVYLPKLAAANLEVVS